MRRAVPASATRGRLVADVAPQQEQSEEQQSEQQAGRPALEDAFVIQGPSSPKLSVLPQAGNSNSDGTTSSRRAPSSRGSPAAGAAGAGAPAWLLRLNPPAWLVDIEQRLEADLPTIGLTVLFMVGLITYERGVQVRCGTRRLRSRGACSPHAAAAGQTPGCAYGRLKCPQ